MLKKNLHILNRALNTKILAPEFEVVQCEMWMLLCWRILGRFLAFICCPQLKPAVIIYRPGVARGCSTNTFVISRPGQSQGLLYKQPCD